MDRQTDWKLMDTFWLTEQCIGLQILTITEGNRIVKYNIWIAIY